jgi:hypothetical protein
MEVHRQLGCGFLEPVYQEALAIEFAKRNIPFVREVKLPHEYKGQVLETKYCADFFSPCCGGRVESASTDERDRRGPGYKLFKSYKA